MYQMLAVLLSFLARLLLLSSSLVCHCALFVSWRVALRSGHDLTVPKGLEGSSTTRDQML